MTTKEQVAGRLRRDKPIVYKATFTQKDDLRIVYGELLLFASGLIEARELVREVIKKDAMRQFEKDLDDHLRVAQLEVKVAEIVQP